MTGITSTVPGAAQTLYGYVQAVAAANPDLNPSTHLGPPIVKINNNFLMVGSFPDGILVAPNTYSWAAIPGQAKLRKESYALQGVVSCARGASDPLACLTDAFTMLNALHQQILDDIGGSGQLSPSGSWGDFTVTMEENGPSKNKGWIVTLAYELQVINAQLQG